MTRRGVSWTVVLALPALLGFAWPGTVEWLCTRGVRQYRAQRYDQAADSFAGGLAVDPGNATLLYNRGTALYRTGDFAGAEESLSRATEVGDGSLRRDAAYNLGNARFSAGDFEGAIDAYKQVLRQDPADGDARYNLELAQRMLEEQQNQQQQQDQDQQQQDEQQDQQDESQAQQQENQEEQQGRDERDQEGQQQSDEGEQAHPQSGEEGQGQQAEETEEGELSAAQARRLLRALAAEDAEMQEIVRRSPRQTAPRPGEKDW